MPTRTPIVKSWHWTVPALALAALACMVAGGAAAEEQESPPRSERAMQDNVPVEPVVIESVTRLP